MAAPPTFPPNLAPPQVPPGWSADWSPQHNTWYYINLTTQASQWNFPVEQAQTPYVAPPPAQYQSYPEQQQPQQQFVPPQAITPQTQIHADGAQPGPGEDRERGLGKIAAGGLLGVAGGLLAGAIFNKEKEENKIPKPHFSFWNNSNNSSNESLNNQQSGGGPASWFSKFGSGGGSQPSFMQPAETAVAGAATGGLFGSIASHMPHMPSHNVAPPPQNYYAASPPPQQHAPHAATQQFATPQYQAPTYRGSGPPLHIHCAAWSDQDITHLVRRMVTPNQSIDFNTDDLTDKFGDPWPGAPKQFSILYSYGQRPWELVATATGRGKFSLLPHEPLSKDRMSYIQPPNSRVIAVVWGTGNALDKDTTKKLTEIETTGEFQANTSWAGFDNLWGVGKVAVAYYRTANGEIKFAAARDGGTVRLPWNPLAKWN
ncbi:hypothetical protein BDZ45DRAFT_696847 [Acephala macrosclerotiorum]|nr:hypothetical protein BDZ45DRAFT_696847 [Acephala macrosclerotiorum]